MPSRSIRACRISGATAYIDADLHATGTILERACGVLDFGQPVAVMLLGILQGIPDQEDPFAGLELIEPGIVQVHRWRPGTGDLGSGRNLAIYAGVGRKP